MPRLVVALALLGAGCYNYAPVATPAPEPGTFVAATLTDSGSLALARYLGPLVTEVRGRYLGSNDQGLEIAVSSVLMGSSDERPWAGEHVTLPQAAVQSIQLRRFSKGKSVLLVGVGVTGVAATVAAFSLIGSGSSSVGTWLPPGRK